MVVLLLDVNWLSLFQTRPESCILKFNELLPGFGPGRLVPRQRRLECRARWRRLWKLIINELDEVLRKAGGLRFLTQEMLYRMNCNCYAMRVLLHEVII